MPQWCRSAGVLPATPQVGGYHGVIENMGVSTYAINVSKGGL